MASRAAGGKDSTERAVDAEVVNSEVSLGSFGNSQCVWFCLSMHVAGTVSGEERPRREVAEMAARR